MLEGGSSPRVRGTRKEKGPPFRVSRFIPAGAGNTIPVQAEFDPGPVHPRGCGEHGGLINISRGPSRFIPAGAGNTRVIWSCRWLRSVHPRGCGEHSTMGTPFSMSFGSSPRVRGTPDEQLAAPIRNRFIPAGAGNTQGEDIGLRPGAVHPRGCGEHGSDRPYAAIHHGSSPRVRGTHLA